MYDRLRLSWELISEGSTYDGPEAGTARMLAVAAPADVFETEDALLLMIDCPGLDPERIEVTATGDELSVTGERVPPSYTGIRVLARERAHGRFARTFPLPFPVLRDQIEAQYRHGVLGVRVPKAHSARPRRIEVK